MPKKSPSHTANVIGFGIAVFVFACLLFESGQVRAENPRVQAAQAITNLFKKNGDEISGGYKSKPYAAPKPVAIPTPSVPPSVSAKADELLQSGDNPFFKGNPHSSEKRALVSMAKSDKKTGVTKGDMDAYKSLNKELPDPFPSSKVRIDRGHPNRGAHAQLPHGHVGNIGHIPVKDLK